MLMLGLTPFYDTHLLVITKQYNSKGLFECEKTLKSTLMIKWYVKSTYTVIPDSRNFMFRHTEKHACDISGAQYKGIKLNIMCTDTSPSY
jgi:hypothetical protein